MVGARPRFRVLSGGGRAELGLGSGSRRSSRSLLGSLAGSVAPPQSPAHRLLSVFSSACVKAKAKQRRSAAVQGIGNGTAKAAGVGWGGAMMGVLPSRVNRYGSVLVI